jgi:putative phosphoesterase
MLRGVLGLLYDVHGNLAALEAVLADAREAGVGRWIIGGDVALFGPYPAETVARLRELADAAWLRGNTDRWLGDEPEPGWKPGIDARAALGDAVADELAGLPFDIRRGETLYVHASTLDDMRSFLPEPAANEDELLDGVPAGIRRLVFGHTHLPFRREARGIELVNPGSVGFPFDGDRRAAWAVVHDDGRVEHRRVAYDHERAAEAILERFGEQEWTAVMAARLRDARVSRNQP